MSAMDAVNREFGGGTLRTAAPGTAFRWKTRAERRSPRYTTCWDELPVARCGLCPKTPDDTDDQ